MSLLRSSLCAAADVLDLVAELADALTVTTERLVIASRHDAHVGVLGDEDDAGEVAWNPVPRSSLTIGVAGRRPTVVRVPRADRGIQEGDAATSSARERRGRPGDSPRRSPGRLVTTSASETGAARRRPGAAAGSPVPPLPPGRGTGKSGVRGYR